MFGQHVQFIENGKDSFTTCFGAILSLLIIVVVLTYSADKLQILVEYGDSNLTEFTETAYNAERIDVDYETSKFNFAFHLFTKRRTKKVADFTKMFDISFNLRGVNKLLPYHQCN